MSRQLPVQTAQGPARWLVDAPEQPEALMLLGHGAGGGVEAPDLAGLARWLSGCGVAVGRFEQPWRTAGKKVAVRPPQLDEAWLEAVLVVRERWPELPLVVGGRSAGARVACRTATACGARAVLCLSFPLHLPGRDTSRLSELLGPTVPRVVLQGGRDPFGGAEELRGVLAAAGAGMVEPTDLPGAGLTGDVVQVRGVPDAAHDLRPARRSGIDDLGWRTIVEGAARAALAAARQP